MLRNLFVLVPGSGKLKANAKGRIRLEANSVVLSQATEPETIPVTPGPTPVIWPRDGAPKACIVSVAETNAPADPTSPLNGAADLAIQSNTNVVIVVETKNFPVEGAVTVRIAPKYAGAIELKAQLASGFFAQALWQATTTFVPGYSTLQVRATAP